MILGKAPVLQKSHLAGAPGQSLGMRAPNLRRRTSAASSIQSGRGDRCAAAAASAVMPALGQRLAHALRPLPAAGEHAHQGLGVAHVVEQAFVLQLGNGGGYDRWRRSPCGSARRWLPRSNTHAAPPVAAPRSAPRPSDRPRGLHRARVAARTPEAQLSFSFSCSPAFLDRQELDADLGFDVLGHLGVFLQEVARVVLALADALALVAVPGAGLLDDAVACCRGR